MIGPMPRVILGERKGSEIQPGGRSQSRSRMSSSSRWDAYTPRWYVPSMASWVRASAMAWACPMLMPGARLATGSVSPASRGRMTVTPSVSVSRSSSRARSSRSSSAKASRTHAAGTPAELLSLDPGTHRRDTLGRDLDAVAREHRLEPVAPPAQAQRLGHVRRHVLHALQLRRDVLGNADAVLSGRHENTLTR